MNAFRIAMPGFSQTIRADAGDTVATAIKRATSPCGAQVPRGALYFVNGHRVTPDATLDATQDTVITVASRARNG